MIASSTFRGPDGLYDVKVLEAEGNDGVIEFVFADAVEQWNIDQVDVDGEQITYGGMGDFRARWGDVYWFRFEPDAVPSVILYWGNQVIVRQDFAAECS